MGKRKPCVWNGVAYPSITAAAEANHVTKMAMSYRVAMGYRCDKDMGSGSALSKPCVWNGVWYPTRRAAAKANHVIPQTMTYRLEKGYTCDEDIQKQGGRKGMSRRKACVWNGVRYPSLKAAAEANGVTYQAMQMRLWKGYTCDDDIKPMGGSRVAVCFEGEVYESMSEAARSNGVSVTMVKNHGVRLKGI